MGTARLVECSKNTLVKLLVDAERHAPPTKTRCCGTCPVAPYRPTRSGRIFISSSTTPTLEAAPRRVTFGPGDHRRGQQTRRLLVDWGPQHLHGEELFMNEGIMTLLRALTCAFKPASCKSSPHSWDDYLDGAAAAILWIESDEDEEIPFGPDGFRADAVALRGDWVKVGRYVFNAMKSLDPIEH